MSSYEKVRSGKLTFKGALAVEKKIKKKKAKVVAEGAENVGDDGEEGGLKGEEIDSAGTGHAPDGKKSKKYEELFPVETKRFGYSAAADATREAALDERVKRKSGPIL